MKRFSLSSVLWILVLLPKGAWGSALVLKNDQKGELTFVTQFVYRGPVANSKVAREATLEMTSLWNESRGRVRYQGREYRAVFVMSYVLDPYQQRADSGSCAENHVRIEKPSKPGDRSFYGMAGRFGTFYTSDGLGSSTTTAHEFGHGLGLDHDDYNQVGASVPGIMFARGTLVKAQYQWNPQSSPGNPGGSINPAHRRVRAEDLRKLDLESLRFEDGLACLGEGERKWIKLEQVVSPLSRSERTLVMEHLSSPDVAAERQSEAHDH